MQNTITDLKADEFPTAFESNMIAFWSPYGRARGRFLHHDENLVWFYTGVQFPLFNGVIFANTHEEETHQVVDQLNQKIKEQGAPALWWIGPSSRPRNLTTLLEQHALNPAGEIPGMAMELSRLPKEAEPVADFTIRKVTNTDMQELWARIAATGTGFSTEAIDQMAQLEMTINDPQYAKQQRYVGFLGDTPVATCALVLDAGVAGIYAVATLPEARRKGIGRLMTLAPLLEAREKGYRIGVLQASSAGYPIYQKLGFQDVCKYCLYLQS